MLEIRSRDLYHRRSNRLGKVLALESTEFGLGWLKMACAGHGDWIAMIPWNQIQRHFINSCLISFNFAILLGDLNNRYVQRKLLSGFLRPR